MSRQNQQAQPAQAAQPAVGMSLESIFLLHHLNALERLQNIITMELPLQDRAELISLQVSYLLHLIPDPDRQIEIFTSGRTFEDMLKRSKPDINETALRINVDFYIVTAVIRYLNSALSITHEDIFGAVGDHVFHPEEIETPAGGEENGSAGIPALSS